MSSEAEEMNHGHPAQPRPMVMAWAEKRGTLDDALGHLTFSESYNGLWCDEVQQRERMEGTNDVPSVDTTFTF